MALSSLMEQKEYEPITINHLHFLFALISAEKTFDILFRTNILEKTQ
jgi:hypothetical protein